MITRIPVKYGITKKPSCHNPKNGETCVYFHTEKDCSEIEREPCFDRNGTSYIFVERNKIICFIRKVLEI